MSAEQLKSCSASVSTTFSWWWCPRPEPLICMQTRMGTFLIQCSCQHAALGTLPEPEGGTVGWPVLHKHCNRLSWHGQGLSTGQQALMFSRCTGQYSHGFISQIQHQDSEFPGSEWGVFTAITHLVARDCGEACLADFSA